MARLADALERLVFLVEKLVLPPPAPDVNSVHAATLDDLHMPTEEDTIRMQQEQQDFADLRQVMPNTPAFAREMIAWMEEQRYVHGEQWQPPQDWRTVLSEAYREAYGDGASAEAPAQAAR